MGAGSYSIMPNRPGLPVTLHIAGRRAVLVGDDPSAAERRSRLEAAGAEVVDLPGDELAAADLEGAEVVICLDPDLGARVAALAPANALIYVHDRPDLSDFSMPALARRGALTIAVATEGLAPALAGRFRQELEALLASGGAALDKLLSEMARMRDTGERERLSVTARKLRIAGRIEIDP
jgi:uroporphyrin-III C-methyltransferase/precorrin-2 dehydrogenase/sirohydrochlorin ferrochelatase